MIFRRISLPSPSIPGRPTREFDLELIRSLDGMISNMAAVFDRGINIDDNLDVERMAIVTDATPDAEGGYAHTLKRVPIGYIVIGQDKAGSIYNGTSSWTDSAIYLRSNVASVTATILVF